MRISKKESHEGGQRQQRNRQQPIAEEKRHGSQNDRHNYKWNPVANHGYSVSEPRAVATGSFFICHIVTGSEEPLSKSFSIPRLASGVTSDLSRRTSRRTTTGRRTNDK